MDFTNDEMRTPRMIKSSTKFTTILLHIMQKEKQRAKSVKMNIETSENLTLHLFPPNIIICNA